MHRTRADTSTSTRTQTKTRGTQNARRHVHAKQKHKSHACALAENVPEQPGNDGVGPGTGWGSLRKICTARGAVSGGMPGVCKGQGGAHLLVDDADQVLDAISFQGVS